MSRTQSISTGRPRFVGACMATLAVALASCSSNPPASPSIGAPSSTGAKPSPSEVFATSQAPATSQPSASETPPASPAPSASNTPPATHAATGSPVATNQVETIHVTLTPGSGTYVPVGSNTYVPVGSLTGCTNTASCQGDYLIGNDPLFDAASGNEVGTLLYVEFAVTTGESLFHSPANVINLTGRGQIAFTETLYEGGSGRPATAAIIGGTGEFLGAIGHVISRSLPGSGDFVIEISGWEIPRGQHAAPATPVAAPERTIHVRDVATNAVRVKVGSLTRCTDTLCQGDYILGNDSVVDAQTGQAVGTLAYACFVVDPRMKLYHCPENSITLSDGGQIVFTEAFVDDAGMPPSTAPVVGGTGEFLGVTGTVTSQKLATGDRDIVIEISVSEAPGTSLAPTPSAAAEPQTIHVKEHATNVSQIRVGSLSGCSNTTSCQGDYMVGDDPLWDAVTNKEIGTLAFECFIVTTGDTLYHCPGITITLTGRGQIVFTEFYWDGVTRPETSPITGGTGEFLGATGTVTSQRGGDFVITITK